jgi:hypothetical protein
MSLAQKQHFNYNLNRFVDQKIFQNLFGRGQALPAKVEAVSGAIVTVSLQLANTGFVLPLIKCPVAGSRYIRLPIQVDDLGIVMPATVNIGNVSGLGTGTPDFSTPGNLAALTYFPVGNMEWTSVDGNAIVMTPPTGGAVELETVNVAAAQNLTVGNGATGSFTTGTGQTVDVVSGIIVNIY